MQGISVFADQLAAQAGGKLLFQNLSFQALHYLKMLGLAQAHEKATVLSGGEKQAGPGQALLKKLLVATADLRFASAFTSQCFELPGQCLGSAQPGQAFRLVYQWIQMENNFTTGCRGSCFGGSCLFPGRGCLAGPLC